MSTSKDGAAALVRRTVAASDPVWLALATILAGLWLWSPARALGTVGFVAENLLLMAPIALAAVVLAGAIRASGADSRMARLFEGRIGWMIVTASLFGAVTPICGIGVVPIISSLLAAGVPLAAVMAFWLSSPVTDPAMLAITAGTLGLPFAVAKTVAAAVIGLAGGTATWLVQRHGGFALPLRNRIGGPRGTAQCCSPDLRLAFWRDGARRALFAAEARGALTLMVKWLALAFALESVLTSIVPASDVAAAVGSQVDGAIAVAVLVGMPLYVDGYAALPLVRGLMDLGMAPGAAMAFLVAGAITSAYASVAVFSLVRWPVFAWYLVLAAAGSLAAGYGYALVA